MSTAKAKSRHVLPSPDKAAPAVPAAKRGNVLPKPAHRPLKTAAPRSKPAPQPAPVVQQSAAVAPNEKRKLVRDSFTMPEPDFALINVLKARAVDLKRPVKKSELLRAGLQLLAGLSAAKLLAALDALAPVKTGRPKKG